MAPPGLEDRAQRLPSGLVTIGQRGSQRANRASPPHLLRLDRLDHRVAPVLEVIPGLDRIQHPSLNLENVFGGMPHDCEHEAVLVPKVVIELALGGTGARSYVVEAGGSHALLPHELCRRRHDSLPRGKASARVIPYSHAPALRLDWTDQSIVC